MKTRALLNTLAMIAGSTSIAFAAPGAREDSSGLFVWIFLGFCALIIVAQLIPALLMVFGFTKGLSRKPEMEMETARETTNE